ncbi:MAG: hypothetical protein RLZZ241_929 [Bacteroidota bacterium]|jgi:acetyl esterase/lipase
MMFKRLLFGIGLIGINMMAQDFQLPIWPTDSIPFRVPSSESELQETNGILRISRVQIPTIEVYLANAEKNTGKAVLILPGGGYRILAYEWEGTEFAKWLASEGITGIVLKYRLPVSESLETPALVPLADAQRAMRVCRNLALDWGIHTNKIGVMGFSAGGHLAATLSTQFSPQIYSVVDDLDSVSARPDFSALIYPVIAFNGTAVHQGSREALLGPYPSEFLVDFFSPQKQITSNTPPAFLVHAQDDQAVPAENSQLYYQKLIQEGISASLHLFPTGGHGFAMAQEIPYLSSWKYLMLSWIQQL